MVVAWLFPEQSQRFFQQVGREQRLIVFEGVIQTRQFLLLDIFTPHQKQIANALNGLFHRPNGFTDHLSAQVLQLLIDQLDDVKAIKHNGRSGQVLHDGGPVGGAHIHGDCFEFWRDYSAKP